MQIIYDFCQRFGSYLERYTENKTKKLCQFEFRNRSCKQKKLVLIVAGYQSYLWEKVLGRIKKYIDDEYDVCIVVPGQKDRSVIEVLDEYCKMYCWSLLITKENKLALAQNKAIELHPDAELIHKFDEDIFISEGYFRYMEKAYIEAEEKELMPIGFCAPTLNVNGATYYKLLQFMHCEDKYAEKYGEIRSSCMGIPAWSDGEAAKFLWKLTFPLDEKAKEFAECNSSYSFCNHRFSIGAILFSRKFWEEMGGFWVAANGILGKEESKLCEYCMDNAYLIIISNKTLAGHFAFGPQKKIMQEFYEQNSDLF